ncbi:MAG: hypothetical protein AAF202_02380 [Pseudomonadota bacterium]
MNKKKVTIWCLALNFLLLAVLCFWADSEAWPVKVASLEGHHRSFYDYAIKPLYLFVLSPFVDLASLLGVYHMDLARLAFALNGLLIAYLGQRLVRKLTKSEVLSFAYVVVLLTSSLFLERGFRVRSDHLGTLIILFCLSVVFSPRFRDNTKLFVILGLGLFAFLATPKSLLVFLCFLPFLWRALALNLKTREGFDWFLTAWGCLFVLVAVLGLFGGGSFQHLWSYAVGLLKANPGDLHPLSVERLQYVFQFFMRNPLVSVLIAIKVISICVPRWHEGRSAIHRGLDFSLLLIFFVVLIYPNRLPFFLASLLPLVLLILFSLDPDERAASLLRDPTSVLKRALLFGMGVHIAFGLWTSQKIYRTNSNLAQRRFVALYSPYLTSAKDAKVYDPSGLIPNKNVYHYYLGPGQVIENRNIAYKLQTEGFDIVFLGQRIAWIFTEFTPLFMNATMIFPPGLIVSGHSFSGGIEEGAISARDILDQIDQIHGDRDLPIKKVFIRNASPDLVIEEDRKIAYKSFGKLFEYDSDKGISLSKLHKTETIFMHPKTTEVIFYLQDFPIDNEGPQLKRILAFDKWL